MARISEPKARSQAMAVASNRRFGVLQTARTRISEPKARPQAMAIASNRRFGVLQDARTRISEPKARSQAMAIASNRRFGVLQTARSKQWLLFSGFSMPRISESKARPQAMAIASISSPRQCKGWIEGMKSRYGSSFLWLMGLGYFMQGFRCFPWLAMAFHLKDGFSLDPAHLQFLQSTVNLPMVIKPIFGILSDAATPRKSPYLMLAGSIQAVSWMTIAIHQGARHSIGPLMSLLLLSNVGAAIAEVANDALIAKAACKQEASGVELRSFAWLALASGGIMGNLTAGMALQRSIVMMFGAFAAMAAGHVLVSALAEESSIDSEVQTEPKDLLERRSFNAEVRKQGAKLAELVTDPQISRPMLWFVLSYATVPTLGGSLFCYQAQHLQIPAAFLGLARVMGQISLLAGSAVYSLRFSKSSPRRVLLALQLLLVLCMLSDLFLVGRWNVKLGIPDRFYVLGAPGTFVEAVSQFKLLPFSALLSQLCPAGSEASLLAFLMSCHCLASIVSGYAGTLLASCLSLSATDSYAGLTPCILIQSLGALLPALWISSCIPQRARSSSE